MKRITTCSLHFLTGMWSGHYVLLLVLENVRQTPNTSVKICMHVLIGKHKLFNSWSLPRLWSWALMTIETKYFALLLVCNNDNSSCSDHKSIHVLLLNLSKLCTKRFIYRNLGILWFLLHNYAGCWYGIDSFDKATQTNVHSFFSTSHIIQLFFFGAQITQNCWNERVNQDLSTLVLVSIWSLVMPQYHMIRLIISCIVLSENQIVQLFQNWEKWYSSYW
jgi:hypothetical protein